MLNLKAKQRDSIWSDVERLGTPQSRLGATLGNRKASWVKEGLVARVRHLKGEDKLRHAVVKSVGKRAGKPDELDPDRHPAEE